MSTVFDHIQTTQSGSLQSKVFHTLQEAIIDGQYREGESLTELRLSKELGVSRTPVREAIHQLALEGLVEYTPNKSAVVKGITEKDIADIYEIRVLIEGLAAARAATRIRDDELEAIRKTLELEEFFTQKRDAEQLMKIDTMFHNLIFHACDSTPLRHMLTTFHRYVQRSRSASFSTSERAEKVYEEHRTLYKALEERNAKKAEEAMIIHVRNARVQRVKTMKEQHKEENDHE